MKVVATTTKTFHSHRMFFAMIVMGSILVTHLVGVRGWLQTVKRTTPSKFPFQTLSTFHCENLVIKKTQDPSRHVHQQRGMDQRSSTRLMSTLSQSSTTSSSSLSTIHVPKELPKAPRKFVPYPFQYHQEVTIRIDSLTNMGWGIGRIPLDDDEEEVGEEGVPRHVVDSEASDGMVGTNHRPQRLWVIMVPHVVVGELCVVRIFRNQKQYSEADLIQVLEPSIDRVIPQCSLAGICGGCQYQHMSITAQRRWKTKHVEEVLIQQKIRGYYDLEEKTTMDLSSSSSSSSRLNVLPTLGTDEVYYYRSKITPHYDSPKLASAGDSLVPSEDDSSDIPIITTQDSLVLDAIGFQQSSNRNLVDVPHCPIATKPINDKYQQVRNELHTKARDGTLFTKKNNKKRRGSRAGSNNSGMLGATLLFRQADDDIETGEAKVITDHNEYMKTTVKGITFEYLAGNFFQNNNFVLPLMVDSVIEAATLPTAADGKRPTHLIDCYCGSGLFALSAASHFDLCVGIEVNEKAIGEATANADRNGIDNCQFVAASAEAIFQSPPAITIRGFEDQRVQDFPRETTVVVLDPPRKGCSEDFLSQLYEYSPQRIVYMSCGPSTQARDAKGIVEIGGYDIISTQPFDLFPQTKHIECLMIFEKKQNHQ